MNTARRIIAISDLHIGGVKHPMLGAPELLAGFLDQLAAYKPPAGEEVELVIHGDFIDFLAEAPSEAWTASEGGALSKLEAVCKRLPALFNALAKAVGAAHRFTLLLGNHDIELAYPKVRDALLRTLGTEPHRSLFVATNEAYRVGDVLIEHGNRYDPWNAIDHDGLREIGSAASRGEEPPRPLAVCPGSLFVDQVMNPLKERYQFVDLLKPETKLVSLLLTAFEPELERDLGLLYGLASSWTKQFYRKANWAVLGARRALGEQAQVARGDDEDDLPAEVREAFRRELSQTSAQQQVGKIEKLAQAFLGDAALGLAALLADDVQPPKTIAPKRLRKLQIALRAKLAGDRSFDEHDASGECAQAARAMTDAGTARLVIMGHTHLRRNVVLPNGRYLNTGTWADLMQIERDDLILKDDDEGRVALDAWLRKLVNNRLDGVRRADPSYADVTLDGDGHIVASARPLLRRFGPSERFAL